MFKPVLILPICTILVACGTPQEQCIARETRDLRVVDRLISETEGNLQRGYAYEDVVVYRTVWVRCAPFPTPPPVEGAPAPELPSPRLCLDDREETVTRPKAIDLVAEQAKLSGLKAKRKKLAVAGDRSVVACRSAYPE
jgi:hypothetical protein